MKFWPLLLTLAGALGGAAGAYNLQAPILPDPRMTPGDSLTTDPAVICVPGYTKSVRNVPQALKEQIYREYGITSRESGEYEIDHLISLELGGSNSARNLWPESFQTQPLNAHVKDVLENKLHELACGGKITFPAAQQAIAQNWEEAYVKYVGPLPGGVTPARMPAQPSIPVTHVPSLPRGASVPQVATPAAAPAALPDPHQKTPTTPASEPPAPEDPSDNGDANEKVAPNPDGSCPADAPVKVSRSGIYHLPQGDTNYRQTRAVACYADAQDAQNAGYRGVK